MKKIGILFALIIAFGAGIATQMFILPNTSGGMASSGMEASVGANESEKTPLYWVAPMDKNYRRDKPGKSPMGMDLVPVYEEDNQGSDEGAVKISPVVINNLGVRTEKVSKGALELPIQTVGYVAFDEDRLNHIHSRVDGWIEVLNVTSAGDPVSKGQTLYELYSPALVNAQEEYLAALRSGNKTLNKASRSRLLSLGLTEIQIKRLEKRRSVEQRIKVIAERDGYVKDLNVRQGMFIKPAVEIMSTGALDSVWVIAEVFERQAGWVKPGQAVEMRTEALPNQRWSGTVDYLYPVLDSKTRTLRVRVRVKNDDLALKPNMYVDLTITSPVSEETLSIPREALIKSGRYNRVVKALGDGMFKSVLVKVGIESGNQVQILEGLEAGDSVVTSAQFLIDSESNIDAEIARMEARENGDDQSAVSRVMATGKINKIMADMSMLSITHDPIKEWEWPTMKMDFQIAESINLDGLDAGQTIEFELEKQGDWDYLVTAIKGQNQMTDSSREHGQPMQSAKTVSTTGQVKQLMTDMEMIQIVHDPIPEWSWPVMNMTFTLANPDKLPALNAGDRVRFNLTEMDDGDYQVSELEKL